MNFKLPWNPGNRKVQLAVGIVIALVLLAAATQCRAADAHLQAGVGSAIVRGATPVISVSGVVKNVVKDADVEIGVTLLGESSFRDKSQSNNFAWHATLIDGFGRFDVGLGAAYLQNTDEYNGSQLNFHLMLGYRFQRLPLTLRVEHFSNAGTRKPNRGRDMLLLYYRF